MAKVLRKPIFDDQFTLLYELDTLKLMYIQLMTTFALGWLNQIVTFPTTLGKQAPQLLETGD